MAEWLKHEGGISHLLIKFMYYTRWFLIELACLPPALTLVCCSAYFFDPEDGGDMFLRNVG
jgi:hypothetical protein